MKKQNTTKLKKKQIKTSLVKNIEKTLATLKDEKALKKVHKTVKEAASQITKKFFNKLKKRNAEVQNNNKPAVKSPASYRRLMTPEKRAKNQSKK